MTKETFASPEFDVQVENYLNLYHGVENLDSSKLLPFSSLSQEEQSTFEQYVERVKAYDMASALGGDQDFIVPDKMTLLRFLQSDDFDSDAAMNRIIATLKFHQEIKLGPVISNKPENLATYRKIRVRSCMGRTKEGIPIFVERLGGFMNGIPSKEGKSMSNDDWIQCFLYDLGELLQKIRETYTEAQAKEVTWKATWVMDCRGISLFKSMKAMNTIKMIDSLMEPNFPELAGSIYMINAPSVVAAIWKVSKVFLDPAVVAKIQIHSDVPKDLLLEKMDESVLFEEYGGSNKKVFPKSDYI